ncbi:MAG: adaptor protein MecA [Defluviitaleaceae bacterium]|nr:adaptor protein MecA [Defluviitaleaceae bacterium]
MRIERISDTQIKFVLMTDDLEERDIKINELSHASDKTQQLFREIMTLVQDEYEFAEGETPLMFEAMRMGVDSLVVVVTKMSRGMEKERQFSLIPAARQECKFKRQGVISQPEITDEESHSIFSFESLDMVAEGAARLPENFEGISEVHKMDNAYYLMISNETKDLKTTEELEAVLYEYGQKHVSNAVSRRYIVERGEVIIAENAVDKLRMYSGY